jgi:hypothetical protein
MQIPLQRTRHCDEHKRHVKIHARKKALTMVHPLDEPVDPKPVDPFDVPTKDALSEESQME